jgi:hypothetical protein
MLKAAARFRMFQKSWAMRRLAAMTARIFLSVGTGVRGRSGVRDPVDELEVEQSEKSDDGGVGGGGVELAREGNEGRGRARDRYRARAGSRERGRGC